MFFLFFLSFCRIDTPSTEFRPSGQHNDYPTRKVGSHSRKFSFVSEPENLSSLRLVLSVDLYQMPTLATNVAKWVLVIINVLAVVRLPVGARLEQNAVRRFSLVALPLHASRLVN